MKKILVTFLVGFSFVPLAGAATLYSDNTNSFSKNDTRDIAAMTITATAVNEITAANGINLMLDPNQQILWDKVDSLTAAGTAVTNGKMPATVKPEYQKDYLVMHIPVTADFVTGEAVTLRIARIRAYHYSFSTSYIQLDINGDGVSDAQDVNKLEVTDYWATDFTPPYPPTDVTVTLSSDLQSIKLTWHPSPDYDSLGTILDRVRVRGGISYPSNLLNNTPETSYTDTDILPGDVVTYTLYANDGRNLGETVEKTIEVKAAAAEIPPATEADQLTSLYASYKVRYSIKCYPAGRIVLEGDSACLWSKIDLIYTQEKLGKNDVQASLSAVEKTVIGKRIPYSEARYQTNCVSAATPAKYCTALGNALIRAHYFLEQK